MKCLIDTNVLISASLFPNSITAQAYYKAVTPPYTSVVCDYSIDELHRVYNKKFADKLYALDSFMVLLLRTVKVIDTPSEDESIESEEAIRDLDDRPILRAAIKEEVDIIITGDKDFLESGLVEPHILNPSDFVNVWLEP